LSSLKGSIQTYQSFGLKYSKIKLKPSEFVRALFSL
jgi:hypothetical protein